MSLQTFFDNFVLLIDAPNSVDKLRGLILRLAVEGKLVSQRSNDKSANNLLSEIKIQQAKLFNGKKLKASDPISNADIPFPLPINWTWTRLGNIVSMTTGFAFKSSDYSQEGTFVLRVTNIEPDGRINKEDAVYFPDEKLNSQITKYFLDEYDLLVVMVGGSLGKIGIVTPDLLPALLNQNMWRIKPIGFSYQFLLLLLKYINAHRLKITSSTHGHLVMREYQQQVIGLPPLAEQDRIVAKVDHLMRLCDSLETQQQATHKSRMWLNNATLAPLNRAASLTRKAFAEASGRLADNFSTLYDSVETVSKLRTTILQLAVQGKLVRQNPNDEPAHKLVERIKKQKEFSFQKRAMTDEDMLRSGPKVELPYAIPASWQWVRLSEISDIGTGSTPLSSNSEYYNQGEIAWVTSAATAGPFICDVATRISSKAVSDYRLRIYPAGTLIVALYGQGKTRGQISQLKIDATINQACAAVCLIESSDEHSRYITIFIEKAYDELRALASGGAQPNLNVRKIKQTLVPLPPLEEQKRIVAKVDELTLLCDELECKLHKAEANREKLMTAAVQYVLSSTVGTRPHEKLSVGP